MSNTLEPQIRCKLLLLNGPPGCGKDTVATALKNYAQQKGLNVRNVVIMKCAAPIKAAYPSLLGRTNSDELDLLKDEEYLGVPRGIRKVQIALSEDVMKPIFGQDIFARILAKKVACLHSNILCIISDCGFMTEYKYLFYRTPRNNFLTLRLSRGNTTFEGDSRSYIHEGFDAEQLKQHRIMDVNNDIDIKSSVDGYIDLIARNLHIDYDIMRLDLSNIYEFTALNTKR